MGSNHKAVDERPVAGYARVSTTAQAKYGGSLENQERLIRLAAELYAPGAKVVMFTDTGSGKNDRRPNFQAMTADLRRGRFRAVFAWSHDRLCRNASQFSAFVAQCEKGEAFLALQSLGIVSFNAAGRLLLNILAAAGEYEGCVIGERVQAAWEERRRQGKRGPGLRPFGWEADADGFLQPVEREQSALQVALASRAQGRSWTEVARLLTASGCPTVTGTEWSDRNARCAILAAARRLQEQAAVHQR